MKPQLLRIWLLGLLTYFGLLAEAQIAMPDYVCTGATKSYWVDDSPGSVYTWTLDGVTQPTTANLLSITWTVPGTHTLTVQENALSSCPGPVRTGDVYVTDPVPAMVTVSTPTPQVCAGTMATFTASAVNGGSSPVFSWFVNGGSAQQTGVSNMYSYVPTQGDVVSVQMTSSLSCATNNPASAQLTMTVGSVPIATTMVSQATCGASNGSIDVSTFWGLPPLLFSRDGGLTWQADSLFTGLSGGNYPVVVKDAVGCGTATLPVTVPAAPQPIWRPPLALPSICNQNNGSIQLSAQAIPPLSFRLNANPWQSDSLFVGLAPGNYTAQIKDGNNCISTYPVTIVVIQQGGVNFGTIVASAATCSQANGTITCHTHGGQPPLLFSIDNGLTWQQDSLFTGLLPGNYIPRVKDANLCEVTYLSPVEVEDAASPSIAKVEVTQALCGRTTGAISFAVFGKAKPLWFSVDAGVTWQADSLFPALPPGNYNLQIKDNNGCEQAYTGNPVTIAYRPAPQVMVVSNIPATNGQSNGVVTLSGTGMARAFEFSLDGLVWQSDSVFLLPGGLYTGYLRDQDGCVDRVQFTMLNFVTGVVNIQAGSDTACAYSSFSLPITTSDFKDIARFSLQVQYDPTFLQYSGFTNVNPLLNVGVLNISQIASDKVQIDFQSAGPVTLAAIDKLLELTFTTVNPGNSLVDWNWVECALYAAQGYQIPSILMHGSVEVVPLPSVLISGGGAYCEGDVITLTATSAVAETYQYSWSGPGGTSAQGAAWVMPVANASAAGLYTVTSVDRHLCTSINHTNVVINPNPVIRVAVFDTLCANDNVVLDPGPGYISYTWQDGATTQQLTANNQGLYWVEVKDLNGCLGHDTIFLQPCDLFISVPNAFTPASDGPNNIFKALVNYPGDFSFRMEIYNKWGQRIFSSLDIQDGWDGTFNGKACPMDVYTWIIFFSAQNEFSFEAKSPRRGTVLLLR